MKTKLCRPILIPQDKAIWSNCLWLGRTSGQLNLDHFYDHDPQALYPIDNSMLPQQLILASLDPNEKLENGDLVFDPIGNRISNIQQISSKGENFGAKKVIATQDQLPLEYIQKFVEEYNGGKMKNVEIEMILQHDLRTSNKSKEFILIPKLINRLVTIVDFVDVRHIPFYGGIK